MKNKVAIRKRLKTTDLNKRIHKILWVLMRKREILNARFILTIHFFLNLSLMISVKPQKKKFFSTKINTLIHSISDQRSI